MRFETKEMELAYWLNFSFYIVYAVIFFVSIFFYLRQREHEPIRSRGWLTSVVQTFITHVFFFILATDAIVVKCFLHNSVTVMLPMAAFPYFLRAIQLWGNSKIYESMSQPVTMQNLTNLSSTNTSAIELQETQSVNSSTTEMMGKQRNSVSFYLSNRRKTTDWVIKHRWITGPKFQIYSLSFLVVFALITSVLYHFLDEPVYSPEVRNNFGRIIIGRCDTTNTFLISILGMAVVGVGLIISIVGLWSVRDELLFKLEMKINLLVGVPLSILWVLPRFFDNYPIFLRGAVISETTIFLFFLSTIVMPLLECLRRKKIYLREKRLKSQNSKASIEYNTLDYILDDRAMLKSFQKFCSMQWCVENLFFYQAVRIFKNLPENKRRQESLKIWKTFLNSEIDSTLEINIDDTTRKEIADKMNNGYIGTDLFDSAFRTVYTMLRYSILPLWKEKNPHINIDLNN